MTEKYDIEIRVLGINMNVANDLETMVVWKRGARKIESKVLKLKPHVKYCKIKNLGVSFHSDMEKKDGIRAIKKVNNECLLILYVISCIVDYLNCL